MTVIIRGFRPSVKILPRSDKGFRTFVSAHAGLHAPKMFTRLLFGFLRSPTAKTTARVLTENRPTSKDAVQRNFWRTSELDELVSFSPIEMGWLA